MGCAVTTISSNLTEMSKGVKLLAALMEDEGGNGRQLLQAAKNLASAVSDLLKTAQPASAEVGDSRGCGAERRVETKGSHRVRFQGLLMSLMLILPRSLQPRQNLLQAAGLVGQTSGELLQQIGESDTDPRFQVSVPSSTQGRPLPTAIGLHAVPGRRALGRSLAGAWW